MTRENEKEKEVKYCNYENMEYLALFIIYHSPFLIPHSPFIIHHSPFIIHHSSFIIHHSSFLIHHSPFLIPRSPFTIPQSPSIHSIPTSLPFNRLSIRSRIIFVCICNAEFITTASITFVFIIFSKMAITSSNAAFGIRPPWQRIRRSVIMPFSFIAMATEDCLESAEKAMERMEASFFYRIRPSKNRQADRQADRQEGNAYMLIV